MLGNLQSSMIVEEVLDCFYAQLELSKDILNPIKYSADDRSRCFEVSKARIVPLSLLAQSIRAVVAAGRNPKTCLREAAEDASFKLMFAGISPSTLPWLIADTLDNMFRTDLMILMQYFCKKLEIPNDLLFKDVLVWLR